MAIGDKARVQRMAENHVSWLLDTFIKVARPLMIEEFIHGHKHGRQDEVSEQFDKKWRQSP